MIRSAIIVLVLLALVGRARGDFLKSSPGELTKSHASIDSQDQCTTCHESDGAVTANKCLGCHQHDDMKARIAAGKGFHASSFVKSQTCKACHKEHRGRGFNPMGWETIKGESSFDHKLAGWPLAGKHASTDCARCHTTSNKTQHLRTYLHADTNCGSCHAKDSPHGAVRAATKQCGSCHNETVWKPAKTKLAFDHDDRAQAAMPLEGAHADTACAKCHPKSAFKLAFADPASCGNAGCHASPHDGQLFSTKKCETCHSPALRTLRDVRFDHKKQTGYALVAKHAQLPCESCHTKSLGKKKPPPGCESCHAKDSKHGTRFAKFPTCATCHQQRAWKTGLVFNHARDASWPLTGKHGAATCRTCHRGSTPADYERFDIKNGCMSCHRHKTAHGGKFTNSECTPQCHKEAGSKELNKDEAVSRFHGEQSKFPLHDGHANIDCKMCHLNDVYEKTPTECGASCHEDSLHKGSLGEQCSRCHEPGKWQATRFDHATKTKWPLKGKHKDVKDCASCHPSRADYTKTPTTCAATGCHAKDDVHGKQLGDQCQKCHDETGAILFRHNRDAKFKIDGKHQPLVCASCHKSIAFKPVRKDCVGCHAEPAVHKGRYGTACERCHSTTSFTDIKALHDVGDFSLTGAHDQLECARCHPHGEKLRGSGNLCITCHRRDDIHQNALSPRCGECHTQRSFAPARFDHVTVGCSLMGLHSTLPCADCHRSGNYGAVSPLCVSCHRSEALRVRQPDHRQFPLDCGSCHNPSAWVPATQLGSQTICR
jgi:hypothetical protein